MGTGPSELIKPELAVGEQIQWIGTPSFNALLLRSLFPIVFGSIFAIAPFMSEVTWATSPSESFSKILFSSMFIMVGLSQAAPALLGVCAAGRTAYAITNRRILVVQHVFKKRVQTFAPGGINTLEYRVRADGTGSVFFRKDDVHGPDGSATEKFGLFGVQNVAGAVRALDQLRTQGTQQN